MSIDQKDLVVGNQFVIRLRWHAAKEPICSQLRIFRTQLLEHYHEMFGGKLLSGK